MKQIRGGVIGAIVLSFGLSILVPLSASAAPVNQALPVITGATTLGSTLSVSTGTWAVAPTIVNYQWLRCTSNTDRTKCSTISGATTNKYVVTASDTSNYFLVSVTALDSTGSGTTVSSAITGIVIVPPVNTVAPAISGTASVGSTLTTTVGTWTGLNNAKYLTQWYRCNSTAVCTPITSATNLTYTILNSDIGYNFQTKVTLFDSTSVVSATGTSAATGFVSSAPISSNTPILDGYAIIGNALIASTGLVYAYPAAAFAYQWQSCTSSAPGTCVNIPSQTSQAYTILQSDAGKYFRAIITITNSLGGIILYSPITGPAAIAQAPISTSLTTIDGIIKVGQALTSYPGNWSGVPYPTFTRQWQRCTTVSACLNIPGAMGNQYTLVAADEGFLIRADVIGTNSGGVVNGYSAFSMPVAPLYANKELPTISGTPKAASTLKVSTGTWESSTATSFVYQWQRCTSNVATACLTIPTFTTNSYIVEQSDVGNYLRAGVQLQGNLTYSFSSIIGPIVAPAATPSKSTAPAVVKKGALCSKLNLKKKVGKVTYTCKKLPTGKLAWK